MPSCQPKQEAWRPPLPGLSGDPPVVACYLMPAPVDAPAFSITKVLRAGAVCYRSPWHRASERHRRRRLHTGTCSRNGTDRRPSWVCGIYWRQRTCWRGRWRLVRRPKPKRWHSAATPRTLSRSRRLSGGTLKEGNDCPEVTVLAAAGGSSPHYLIRKVDESSTWTVADNVRILGPR